jgi:hypothetical protein
MKWLITVMVGVAGVGILWAAEQAASTVTNGSPAQGLTRVANLSETDAAAFAKLKKAELELSSRIALLTELADEHTSTAEALPPGQAEKAAWEKRLAQDLRDRMAAATRELGVVTKQVLNFEAAHGLVAPPILGFGTAGAAGGLGPDELVYLSSLQERLGRVQQELLTAMDAANSYTLELQTNNTPETVARVSFLVELNGREVRVLEREKADLELRKLEFRAMKK